MTLILLAAFGCAADTDAGEVGASRAPVTTSTLVASADMTMRTGLSPSVSHTSNYLTASLTASPSEAREIPVVAVDPAALRSLVAGQSLWRAELVFDQNGGVADATYSAHRVTQPWTANATPTCADDQDPDPINETCDPEDAWDWNSAPPIAAQATGATGEPGPPNWDLRIEVTADVAAALSGGTHLSWAILTEGPGGTTNLATLDALENAPGAVPELHLEFADTGYVPSAPVAPALDQTVTTGVLDSSSFLFDPASGDPTQWGVSEALIPPAEAAVVHGLVHNATSGSPLAGVDVEVLHHPELGRTRTRSDGRFDLVVAGGRELTLALDKGSYHRAQRTVLVGAGEHVWSPDVGLLAHPAFDIGGNSDDCSRIAPAGNRLFVSDTTTDSRVARHA